jgi:glycine cleavage system H protein
MAEENPQQVNDDPCGTGWMARGRPARWAEERTTLVDAAAYRRHILAIEPEKVID